VNNRERVAFHTLGCKVNQEETASLMEMFRKRGFQLVDFKSPADVYIINTCTVTHTADQKSRQMIRRAISRQPDALVAVVGCYSQVSPDDVLAIPGVDLVVGTRGRAKLVDLVEDILEKKRAGEFVKEVNAVDSLESDLEFEQLPLPDNPQRTRAFLKIEDGCDQYCAYCIIPDARGPVRSLSPELVKEQLGELICAGYREVVLTGVHTSAYGKDLPVGINLAALLRDLVKMPGDFRIRLSSVEPVDVSEELLEVMASSPRICRHLHLPLQSGDDEILEMMQRPYTTADYSELFQKAIKMIPDLAVTTDVMVGYTLFWLIQIFLSEYRRLLDYKYTFMVLSIVFLIFTIIFGVEAGGARSWLSLGSFRFQASEFVKVFMVIFLAGYLEENKEILRVGTLKFGRFYLPDWPYLGPLLVVCGFSLLLLVFQKDLGMALLFFVTFLVMVYIATERSYYLLLGAAVVPPCPPCSTITLTATRGCSAGADATNQA
jgi:MiaB/RimO family radical SAM methylthiotransferase